MVLSELAMAYVFRKKDHEAKILLKISDHQQSRALAPARGLAHTHRSAGGR
jgi:hypothetical protein